MKGGRSKKSVRVEFVMSEQEAELVKEHMAELGITNLSAYLRKMAVDGYIIHLDMGDIQEMIRLLRICSNNLNQYIRRANETGSVYAADVEDLRTGRMTCGIAWISCSGDLQTFRKRRKQPLFFGNRHGRISVEGYDIFPWKEA